MRGKGTILQEAVAFEGKQGFVRILLDSGLVRFSHLISSFCFRVDPNSVCEDKKETPMEIAASSQHTEVFKMLAEVTEITDKVKLIQMSVLMKSDKPKRAKKEFQSLLKTLPVDLVNYFLLELSKVVFPQIGEHHKCARPWDTFAKCCIRGKN